MSTFLASTSFCSSPVDAPRSFGVLRLQHALRASDGVRKVTCKGNVSTVNESIPQRSELEASFAGLKKSKYLSVLPPVFERATLKEPYAEGLMGVVQPLELPLVGDVKLRMVIARLEDGSILVHNPVAPTPDMLAAIQDVGGPVSHVLLSSNSPEHWYYAAALLDKFPQAQLWVVAGFFDTLLPKVVGPFFGLSKLKNYHKLGVVGQTPGPLNGQVEVVVFRNPFTVESAVILTKYEALLVSDSAGYFSGVEYDPAGAEALGVWQRLGPLTRQLFEQYKQEGKAWVEAVAQYEFCMIIPGHGCAPVTGDAKQQWLECFDFL